MRIRRRPAALACIALAMITAMPWSAARVSAATVVFRPVGSSFESPVLAPGTTSDDVSSTAWTFTGTAGLAHRSASILQGATPVPNGAQVAVLRGTGRVARQVGLTPTDVVKFAATQRRSGVDGPQSIGVYVNGALRATVTPGSNAWTTHRIPIGVRVEGAFTVELRGTASGNRAAFVDQFVVERTAWTVARPAFVAPGPRSYERFPAAGLPAERRSVMRGVTEVLRGGVTGLLTAGDSEPEVHARVLAFAEWNGRIYVGGKFASVQRGAGTTPQSQSYLAAFDRQTGAWIDTFRPDVDGPVWDMAITPTGRLVIAGQFTSVDGESGTEGLAALDPLTGAVVDGWRADVSIGGGRALVRALDVEGDWIYVGGVFSRIEGGAGRTVASVQNLARVAVADGRPSVAAFVPRVEGTVVDVDATPTRIYAAGHISAVNGVRRRSLAVLNPVDGTLVGGLGSIVQTSTVPSNQYMQGVLEVGSTVWINGSQHNLQAYRRADLGLVRSWVNEPHGDGQALAVVNGIVYSGSHANRRTFVYTDVASWPPIEPGSRIDAISWIGAFDSWSKDYVKGFVPDVGTSEGEGAWELFVDSRRCLWAGGDFSRGSVVDGVTRYAAGFVKFCPVDDVVPSTPTNPTHAVSATGVRLTWGVSTDDRPGVTYEVLRNGRVVATGLTGTAWNDPAGRSTDLYMVRAADAAGNRSATTARLGG